MTGSYNVQECDVSSDQHTSSILVECTFAINSTAPGIVVIQDDQSQYTINKTLQRLLQDSDKGSVNITGLPAGEYSVRVYDNSPATDSTSAAYQHSQLIHIMELPSATLSISAYVSGKLFGKNKIQSTISPNKTYEGYFGSFILTIIVFVTICEVYDFEWTMLDVILLITFIVSAFYGDFLMSLIKRVFSAKDSGSMLPGHGGFLDRIDSYFTSLPIFYFWFLF